MHSGFGRNDRPLPGNTEIGSYKSIIFAGFILLVTLIAVSSVLAKGGDLVTDENSGWRYILRQPADTKSKAPLVLVLHGMGGEAKSMSVQWGTQPGMDKMYVLTPQAPRQGDTSTWQGDADAGALLKLLDKVTRENNVDPRRIAVVGYSAGSFMAMRLARGNPDRFAACVVMGGAGGKYAGGSVAKVKFYLLAAELDGSFNAKKADDLASSLTGEGASVQVEVVPGADHASLYAKNRGATDWLVTVLGAPKQPLKP